MICSDRDGKLLIPARLLETQTKAPPNENRVGWGTYGFVFADS